MQRFNVIAANVCINDAYIKQKIFQDSSNNHFFVFFTKIWLLSYKNCKICYKYMDRSAISIKRAST